MSQRRPISTTRPAYMTITRSHISAMTPRSCVISRTAMPYSRCSLRIRSRICAWIVTSSAVVGSSAISRRGLPASAMAIITRWRMPPESSCGYAVDRALADRESRHASTTRSLPHARPAPASFRRQRSTSPIWSPTRITGLSAVIGSWKIMAISPPRLRASSRPIVRADPSSQQHAPRRARIGIRQQAHDRQRQHALPAARLAHHAERFTGAQS